MDGSARLADRALTAARATRSLARALCASTMAAPFTRADANKMVTRLNDLIPEGEPSQAQVKQAEALLDEVAAKLESSASNLQKLWVAKVHHALGAWLQPLMHGRPAHDPEERLLYSVCDALRELVCRIEGDLRAAVGDHVLGSLATIAMRQREHDAEATEMTMRLFLSLFSNGSEESRKHLKARFFGQGKAGRDETSTACLGLLGDPKALLANAQTHQTQLAFCDILVRHRAAPPRRAAAASPLLRFPTPPRRPRSRRAYATRAGRTPRVAPACAHTSRVAPVCAHRRGGSPRWGSA